MSKIGSGKVYKNKNMKITTELIGGTYAVYLTDGNRVIKGYNTVSFLKMLQYEKILKTLKLELSCQ